MAIFWLQISSVSRGAGRRATAAAAYRAGERIRDDRTGELINYSRRQDVMHREILLPTAAESAEWARDRGRLWNAAEAAEKRRNSLVAREFLVALPAELDGTGRAALARGFARELAQRYSIAVDLTVHAPREAGDERNHHAHLLATTREVTLQGLGAKTGLDRFNAEDWRTTIEGRRTEFRLLRERWATLTNEALAAANLSVRVDHRSLKEQGIDREPYPRLSMVAAQMERRGQPSAAAERLRQDWRERVQAGERAPEREHAPQAGETGSEAQAPAPAQAHRPATLEDVRRQARESWLRMRDGLRTGASAGRGVEQPRDRARDDEHSL